MADNAFEKAKADAQERERLLKERNILRKTLKTQQRFTRAKPRSRKILPAIESTNKRLVQIQNDIDVIDDKKPYTKADQKALAAIRRREEGRVNPEIRSSRGFRRIAVGNDKTKRFVEFSVDDLKQDSRKDIENKLNTVGLSLDKIDVDANVFGVEKGENQKNDNDTLFKAIDAFSKAANLDETKRKAFVGRFAVKGNEKGTIKPIIVSHRSFTGKILDRLTPKEKNAEILVSRKLTERAREGVKKMSVADFDTMMRGIQPGTAYYSSNIKRYGSPEKWKEAIEEKVTFSLTKANRKKPINMVARAILGDTNLAEDPDVTNLAFTKRQAIADSANTIARIRTPEEVARINEDIELDKKIEKLNTPQNVAVIQAWADSKMHGERDSHKVLKNIMDHPTEYAEFALFAFKNAPSHSPLARASTTTVERNIQLATGMKVPVNIEKGEKMAEPGSYKAQFKKKISDAFGVQTGMNQPIIRHAMDSVAENPEEMEQVAKGEMSIEDFAKEHPLPWGTLYDYSGKKERKALNDAAKWRSWGGDVPGLEGGGGRSGGERGGGEYETKGTGKRGRPIGSTAKATKKEEIIRPSKGRLISGGRPWFSRREAVEKPSGGYEFPVRRGTIPAKLGFMTAEERKEEFKENRAEVKKIQENLKKSGLALNAKERNRLANMSESRRERKLEAMIAKKEEKQERVGRTYGRYEETVGKEEAARLARPSKEGGYGFFNRLLRGRRAEKMRTDEAYRQKVYAKETEREGSWRYQNIKASRIASQKERIAASKWWTAIAQMNQTTKWAIIIVCAVALLFLPVGLFYCVGWAMAVALVTLIQFIVWVFISMWFLLAQGAVAVIGGAGQLFIGGINGLFQALLGWMGQPYQPFEWQWIQNMPMFKQDATGNWILLTYTDANGVSHNLTWGTANLVPPSFMKLDSFMPRVFDTNPIIAYILPPLRDWFNWFYGPIAQMYTNWITTAQWYEVGITIGLPFIITFIVVGAAYWYYRAKIKPRMY